MGKPRARTTRRSTRMAERPPPGYHSPFPTGGSMASEPLDSAFHRRSEQRLDASQPIPLVAPTRVAFLGRTERGPLNEPVALASFDDYRRTFGNHCSFSFVSLAVQHFFQHGGQTAIVVRVANRALRSVLEIPAGGEILRLQARQPGARELLRVSVDYDRVERDEQRFNLVVQRVSRPGSQLIEDQEFFQRLSIDPADERFVATALEDSDLVRLAGAVPRYRPDATRAHRPGDPIPYLDMCSAGTDGEELTDYDIVGSNKEGTGLFALDREQFDLLCIPPPPGRDLGSTSFLAAERYCERRRAMLIWDPPWSWYSVDSALLGVRHTPLAGCNAVTYFPRGRPRGDFARFPSGMPACGAVAGILARSDRSGVWRPAAAADSLLRANLAPLIEVAPKHAAMLRTLGVNTFIRVEAGNFSLYGNACGGAGRGARLSQVLDRRRLALFVLNAIERHTRWALALPAEEHTAAELERQIWIFLSRLHQQGAFGERSPEHVFYVHAAVGEGADFAPVLLCRLAFAPRGAAELLGYRLRYADGEIAVQAVGTDGASGRPRVGAAV